MIQSTLVPTNFSPCASNAARFACDLVRENNGKVILLHACDPSECTSAQEHVEREKRLSLMLSAQKKELQEYAPQVTIETVIYDGRFVSIPTSFIARRNIDLMVIGTDGIDKDERHPQQTNTEKFMARHPVDMLIVPNGVAYEKFDRVLFASDYRPHLAGQKMELLREFMNESESDNYVLHVNKKPDWHLEASQIIAKQNVQATFAHESPEFHEISCEKIEEGILKFVNSYEIDLVGLIPRKNTLSEQIFRKSITKKVAEKAHIPLLIMN